MIIIQEFCIILFIFFGLSLGMVQANDVVRPMSRHSERTPLVLGGTQLHGEKKLIVLLENFLAS